MVLGDSKSLEVWNADALNKGARYGTETVFQLQDSEMREDDRVGKFGLVADVGPA